MKIIKLLFVTLLWLFALTSNAELLVPKLSSRVVDNANILTAPQKDRIEFAIKQLETDTGGQMAVLIIHSLQGDKLVGYSMRVAKQWQIGYEGKDNGAILLISLADHKLRLEVGSGWEEVIDNTKAQAIIDQMGPFFRDRKFSLGIIAAINSIHNYLPRNTKIGSRVGKEPASSTNIWNNLLGMSALLVLLVGIIFCFKGNMGNDSTTYSGMNGDYGYNRNRYNRVNFHTGNSGFSSGSSGFSGSSGGSSFSGGGGGFSGGGASGSW